MTELEQIAASVAKALGLEHSTLGSSHWYDDEEPIFADGRNVFHSHWRSRCTDWLLEHGHDVALSSGSYRAHRSYSDDYSGGTDQAILCPAAEFPARCIHSLMQ